MRAMLAKIHAHPRKNVKETGLCAKKANMPVMGLYKKARRVRVGRVAYWARLCGTVIEKEDTREDYGEQRFRALGRVDDEYYVVAYTTARFSRAHH